MFLFYVSLSLLGVSKCPNSDCDNDGTIAYQTQSGEQALNIPAVMPRISHFIDENSNYVDIGAGGVNVRLKRDGTHKYFRSYGFIGRMELTPVYVL
jgi:hypothetical protein